MGGRLDATNIVTPLAGVITNIGLDHSAGSAKPTGNRSREGRHHKTPKSRCLQRPREPEVLAVIRTEAAKHNAQLIELGKKEETPKLPLNGRTRKPTRVWPGRWWSGCRPNCRSCPEMIRNGLPR
ncbi:MAG: hypothetical protein Ct9H300mP32_2810 [Verrucomicrobiota bacterium]|nr:MAG: hypothetical protein Ct9H300mP32_2810 [Verrucomicrobiota bacterium]